MYVQRRRKENIQKNILVEEQHKSVTVRFWRRRHNGPYLDSSPKIRREMRREGGEGGIVHHHYCRECVEQRGHWICLASKVSALRCTNVAW